MNLRTPYAQATLLGACFFFVFASYDTVQVYAKRIYPGHTGADSTLAVYATFTAASLFAPAVVRAVGERAAIALGIQGYAALVVAGLVYLMTRCCADLVVAGGAVLGVGAALLWTAQGSLVLSYVHVESMKSVGLALTGTSVPKCRYGASEGDRGRIFARFWQAQGRVSRSQCAAA